MMSKTNWTLLILLGIQALIILVLDNPCSSGKYREKPEDAKAAALFPEFSKEGAASLKIRKGDQSIVLEREAGPEGEWFVRTEDDRYAAERFSVDTLLTSLTRLTNVDVVSRNPEKASAYELDGESAIHLTVSGSSGEELVNLLVGKNLGALRGTFVKLPGSDEVYLQLENIRRCCDKGEDWLDSWRDKTVFTCNREEITRVEIDGPEGHVVMEYRPTEGGEDGSEEGVEKPEEDRKPPGPPGEEMGEWWMIEPLQGKIKQWEGRRLVEVISNMKAQGFAKQGQTLADLGLEEPEAVIVTTLKKESGDEPLKISLSAEKEGSRYLVLNDDASDIYKMANYQFYAFIRKPAELLEEPPKEEKEEPVEEEGAEGEGTVKTEEGGAGKGEEKK